MVWIGLFSVYSMASMVYGEIVIDVTASDQAAIPIAVVPFGWESAASQPEDIAKIVHANLQRSGFFQTMPPSAMPAQPHSMSTVDFNQWSQVKMEHLVVGHLAPQADGQYEVQFQLLDVYQKNQSVGLKFVVPVKDLRRTAHRISDIIYEKLTGHKGAFDTRIAYITLVREGKKNAYQLQVADADGQNPKTILKSPQPLMSPSWSANGESLAYVSFEQGQSSIYIQHLTTGQRQKISSSKGINGAPSWSPDGKKLAITLSKDGSPDIYVVELASGKQQRLTSDRAIDTEPVWTKDSSSIVFTSDRGGKPQLYRVSASGGQATRLTFTGEYNARPIISPDGKLLAMVHGENGQYHIATLELESGNFQVLTDGELDESPSFAPNGQMILYATQANNRGVLAAVSIDGRVKQRLSMHQGNVQEPAWSP